MTEQAPEQALEQALDALGADRAERLRWRVRRAFSVLPAEERAARMTDRDYLICALHLILDEREALDALCPACRAEAEVPRCACCGRPLAEAAGAVNPGFDPARFRALRSGGERA